MCLKMVNFNMFIKKILCSTLFPKAKTIRCGDYIIKDCFYTTKNYIVKCTSSGIYGSTGIVEN